jgi:hypothetical protein
MQDRCMVWLNIPEAQKSFWTHSMELLDDMGHVESLSVYLKIVLVLGQDRSTVCAEHTIGSDWMHLEIVLILTQDRSTVCAEGTIGSKIILDAPGGTSR